MCIRDRWEARDVDACWEAYTRCLEELAATRTCDVLAHPDLIKLAGHIPSAPEEWWDRVAEAAAASDMSAEVSSAGWAKPVGEQYPAKGLLERFAARTEMHDGALSVVAGACPFGDAAAHHPVLCAVDRGLVLGMLEGLGALGAAPVTMSSRARGDDACRATA